MSLWICRKILWTRVWTCCGLLWVSNHNLWMNHMLVTTRYGHTVRLLTILRKSTDTFGAAWRQGREPVVFRAAAH